MFIYLGGWYDYYSNQFNPSIGEEGQWIKDVPLKRDGNLTLPLFAREGAIIPLNRITSDGTRIGSDQELRVRVFGGESPTETIVLDDDGSSRGYQNGETQKTRVRQMKTAVGFDVTVFPSIGSYVGAPTSRAQRIEMIVPTGNVTKIFINGKEVKFVASLEELTGDQPLAYLDKSETSSSRTHLL